LASVEWNIKCSKVQDYNDELEHKIMTVLEDIIPFQWMALGRRKMEDSPRIVGLKRKKKNILTNAKRRGSKELYMRGKQIEKKVRELVARSETNRIRDHLMREGNQGVWKGV